MMLAIAIEIAGWMAAGLFLLSYVLVSTGRLQGQSRAYQWLNVVGAIGFVINLGTGEIRADGLKGARIGIPRKNYYEPFTIPGTERPRGGLNPAQTKVMEEAIAALNGAGEVRRPQRALVVDGQPVRDALLRPDQLLARAEPAVGVADHDDVLGACLP